MKDGKKIITDLDDVLADTTKGVIERLNRELGIEATLNDMTDAEAKGFSEKYHIPTREIYERFWELLKDEEFVMSVPPVKGAIETLDGLKQEYPELGIYIVSGRPRETFPITKKWIEEKRIPYEELYLTNQDAKTSLDYKTVKTKDDLVKKLSGETGVIIIEDSPRLIQATIKGILYGNTDDYTNDHVVLIERPWTRDYFRKEGIEEEVENNENIKIFQNWGEPLYIHLKDILSKK